jgi:ferredoxin
MKIETTGLIYFSPTQTTRKVVEGILQGVQVANIQHFDLTSPDSETRIFPEFHNDLAIIGSPVYAGRLPASMVSRFKRIKGNGTPAVIVVVYGNRAYEDALGELRDIVLEAGFKPIAAGAFIGEHSYSTTLLPIAAGRPDADDMLTAQNFGKEIRKKIMAETNNPNGLQVPGNFPYKEIQMLSGIVPSVNEALCSRCGKCVPVCPTAAIDKVNPMNTAKDLCIRCCACVKACPSNAKLLDDPRIKQAAEWLYANFAARKEPEIYL